MVSAIESFKWFGKFGKDGNYDIATYLVITHNNNYDMVYNFIDDKEEANEFKNKCQIQKEIYRRVSHVYQVDIDTYHTMMNRKEEFNIKNDLKNCLYSI